MSDPNAAGADGGKAAITLNDVMLRRLKLKPLLIFERVLGSCSIARAARELNLTQPAVTKAIQELEADLDVPLFERTNRGVSPTCYGQLLGNRVKTVIAELRYLTDEINAFRTGDSGHVIIGTVISASARLLPMAITRLKQQRPGVLVTVRDGPTDQLFPALATGELDIVVGRLPERDLPLARMYAFEHSKLYREALCAVVGCKHPLAGVADVKLADLLDWPWIFPLQVSPARLTAEHLFRDAGLELPTNVVESLSVLTNIGLMHDSPSISLMPRAAAEHFAGLNLLSILALGELGDFGDIGYSIRSDRDPTPAAQAMIKCLQETAASF
ncbi:LysR family transcriptional regulator [Herbaspirillum robiniae]|uniref:LysR family transcriptional regulator n=1 Tax=Herbaspirillum robiniae TaxID=2014887 RepID=A0A246WRM0_9BURK|nr:LysR family transcriptional regulator [Herbaspirillum robiniae]NUU04105.1 LysR family transcriptional regulator [Herbaspirillum robiniae]OWY29010.1 LysR family transcriptional regulator [Herbaspirillum robiniae]